MKKIVTFIACLILIFILISCKSNKENYITPSEDDILDKELVLKIDNIEVNAEWIDNDSTKSLKQLAKNVLTINLEMYGGMEQFGGIGSRLPSNDKEQTAVAGDIMLYQSNKIVLFYGSNTWSYTKLGHINLSQSELTNILGISDVTIELSLK